MWFHFNTDMVNDFFKSNPDFLRPESVCECNIAKDAGDFLYISCYIRTNTSLEYNVIYDPGLCGNLVKVKEQAFEEDKYWSAFNKGSQFDDNILDEGLGAALVILDKKSMSIYNIYYFKDTYNIDTPVKVLDVVENKVVVNFFEYNYVFESGIFIFLTFVDSTFLKLGYLWIAYPTYGYDASCGWHFIDFRNKIESPIHALENEESSKNYKDCYYDFEKCLFFFSTDTECITLDYKTITSLTEEDFLLNYEYQINRIAEEKRCKEYIQDRNKKFHIIKSKLRSAVSSWELLCNQLHYKALFSYYPTTCEFEVTEEDWKHRRLIWAFKNAPERNISSSEHIAVLEEVIPLIKQELCDTFGENQLQFMTFVCLPASTSSKNIARYFDFSKKLCEETYMKNAYPYIHIIEDGMSKNHPENHTGHSIQPIIKYEEDFFRGKCILLFDDIVTKGDTMLKYQDDLEKMGAIVIGGFCLGKTKHERPVQSGQYPNEYDEELPF